MQKKMRLLKSIRKYKLQFSIIIFFQDVDESEYEILQSFLIFANDGMIRKKSY